MTHLPNYYEYRDILEEYSPEELGYAWEALHCSEIQDELFANESSLIAFLIDTRLQDKLYMYIEDIAYAREVLKDDEDL